MPSFLTDRANCMPWSGAAQLRAAVADVLVLDVHKTPSRALSRKEGMGQNSTVFRPLPSLGLYLPLSHPFTVETRKSREPLFKTRT
jgi:hypothetical protein